MLTSLLPKELKHYALLCLPENPPESAASLLNVSFYYQETTKALWAALGGKDPSQPPHFNHCLLNLHQGELACSLALNAVCGKQGTSTF